MARVRSSLAGRRPAGVVFNAWALDERGAQMERAHAPVVRRLLNRLALPPDGWFLDLGCGAGSTVRWAAQRLTRGRAVGLDAAPAMIEIARRQSAGLPRAEFHLAEFPSHPLPPGGFDVIFSMEAVYYFRDISAALAEVRRLLKPGGMFMSAVDFYLENGASHEWADWVGTPMRLLDTTGWRQTFERAGFDRIRQDRVVVPPTEAVEPWHATVGTLLTTGLNPG